MPPAPEIPGTRSAGAPTPSVPPAPPPAPIAPKAHVLAVDDDPAIRSMIADYLAENDIRVSVASNGMEMNAILAEQTIDLVVLDLRLPHEDGMTIAQRLRQNSAIPIIILTGRLDEADRVMGLELGADDYLTKPFSPRELLARIRALLRRARISSAQGAAAADQGPALRALRFSGWELSVQSRRLRDPQGQIVPLSNGEFNLLLALASAPQRVLSRDQLLEMSRLHEGEVYDRSIDVQILRLRRKIETNPSEPQLIQTERGVGYRFAASVQVVN
jgi:two-component system, OmpR family, response regulator